MTVRRLRPVNLTEREHKEIGLLLSLLGERAGAEWCVDDRAGADAAIVDMDRDTAEEALADARRTERVVILLRAEATADDELQLTRPLRSEALIRLLAGIDAPAAGNGEAPTTDAREAVYRLRRWPGTPLLRREWRYTRVCGALGRGPETVRVIAQRTGIEDTALDGLLGALVEAGCVERTDHAGGTRANVPAPAPAPAAGLFGRIRARLART